MKTKWLQKKAKERQLLNDKKFLHKSASHAFKSCTLVAMYAILEVFKERATNPKLMETMITMYNCWEDIGDGKLSMEMIKHHLIDECNIWYDEETGKIVDKGKINRKWNK